MSRKLLVNLLALYILGTSLHSSSADNKALIDAAEKVFKAYDAADPSSNGENPTTSGFQLCIQTSSDQRSELAVLSEDQRSELAVLSEDTAAIIKCAELIFKGFSERINDKIKSNIKGAANECLTAFRKNKIPDTTIPNLIKLVNSMTTPTSNVTQS